MFEKMDKPAKLLFFDKSSSEEKPSSNIKNKVQFACDDDDEYVSKGSSTPRTTIHGNKQGVDLTAKLVVLLPVVVQFSIQGHHDLDIGHSQGHSQIRYGMVF